MASCDLTLYTPEIMSVACPKEDCIGIVNKRCKSPFTMRDVSPHKARVKLAESIYGTKEKA